MIDASLAAKLAERKLGYVLGHEVDHYFVNFPHVCPHENCAIAKWAVWKVRGEKYWRGNRQITAAE